MALRKTRKEKPVANLKTTPTTNPREIRIPKMIPLKIQTTRVARIPISNRAARLIAKVFPSLQAISFNAVVRVLILCRIYRILAESRRIESLTPRGSPHNTPRFQLPHARLLPRMLYPARTIPEIVLALELAENSASVALAILLTPGPVAHLPGRVVNLLLQMSQPEVVSFIEDVAKADSVADAFGHRRR